MKKNITSVLIVFSILFYSNVFSQNSASWNVDYSRSKSFITNEGQFDSQENEITGKIKYAVDFGFSKILFGEKGVSYSFRELVKKTKEEREEIMNRKVSSSKLHKQKEVLAGKYLVRTDEVNMRWINASSELELVGLEETKDYHSYSYKNKKGVVLNNNFVKGYKKLVYKNIYPNIDIEYQVHPEVGVKYAFILRPGAQQQDVQMLFDRDVNIVDGEMHISTLFGDIIDHAPITFYEHDNEEIIESEFKNNGRNVFFNLGVYDNSKAIVIDPWVQTPNDPNSDWNCVWELDKDGVGNVYVIAGIMPMQLIKYNSAGAIQWTHNTPYDTTAWLGTMATDDVGNSYVTNGTSYEIQKINAAGGLVWNNPNPSGGQISTEFWNISFNCDQTKLLVGGTGGNLDIHGRVYDIDMNSGDINSSVQVTQPGNLFSIPPNLQEVRAMCPAPNGKYYFVTLDTIGYLSDNLTLCPGGSSSLLMDDHGIGWGYKSENWRYNNTGIKAIRADANFVYINRGSQLQKRSLQDFSIIASASIPNGVLQSVFLGGNQSHNAGIDIDDCGNVYVGSTDGVYKFDSNLTPLGNFPTAFKVFDVRVSPTGDIIACGGTGTSSSNSRSGGVQSFAAAACSPIAFSCCDATICIPQTMCTTDPAIALVTSTSGGTWSGTGVDPSGNFDPAVSGAGTFDITYTLACGSETISITVDPCSTIEICEELNGDLTASGGNGTYTWSTGVITAQTPITSEQECIDCPQATPQYLIFFYTGCDLSDCPSDTIWTQYGTGITTAPPSSYPIQIVDGNGYSTVINSQIELVPCTADPCAAVTINMNIISQSDPSCFGGSNGAASVDASGGASPYNFVWTPGNLTGATQTALSAGTYNIAIQDDNGCLGSGAVVIGEPTELVADAVEDNPAICGANNGQATASAVGGTGAYSYSWAPSGGTNATATGLGPNTYTVTVTDQNGCTDDAIVIINSTGGPTISLDNSTDVQCFGGNDGTAMVSSTGGTPGYTYLWMPGSLSGDTQSALTADSYTVTVTDAGGCTDNIVVDILEPTELVAGAIEDISASCGLNDGQATASAVGGTGAYSYSWAPSGGTNATATGLGPNTYTVTVTDQNGCTDDAIVIINSTGGPTISLDNSTDVQCFGGNDGTAMVSSTGGTPGYTYVWMPGSLSGDSQSALTANSYTVTVTDAGGCTGNIVVDILEPTAMALSTSNIIPANCGANDGSATVDVVGGTGAYTFSWSPTGGTAATANNIPGGAYVVTVTDQNGCLDSISFTVSTLGGPTITVSSTTNVSCFGASDGSATIVASGGNPPYTYAWSPSGGTSDVATNLGAGNYTVTVTDNAGCVSAENITINEPPAIIIVETIVDENCGQGDGSISLIVTGGNPGFTYLWTPGAETTDNISSLSGGNYGVTVVDASGCTSTANYTVNTVGNLPVIATPSSASITEGESVQLNATGADSYVWSPINGLDCSTCPNPIASPTITTTYIVVGTDAFGCTGSDTVTIFVTTTCADIYVPNIFSPNGVGPAANETLCVYGGCIAELKYVVFNRWGEVIFETTDPTLCWDGLYKGKPMMSGVYAYKLYAQLFNGEVIEESGNVTLVR